MNLKSSNWITCTCNTAVTTPPLPVCPLNKGLASDNVREWCCLYVGYDGKLAVEILFGVSAAHAWDEAWHEVPGTVIAVQPK